MKADILTNIPNELKTIEVDIEKNIFNVNGVPFGDYCTSFSISCEAVEGFKIRMEMDTKVELASYERSGKKISDNAYEKHSQ